MMKLQEIFMFTTHEKKPSLTLCPSGGAAVVSKCCQLSTQSFFNKQHNRINTIAPCFQLQTKVVVCCSFAICIVHLFSSLSISCWSLECNVQKSVHGHLLHLLWELDETLNLEWTIFRKKNILTHTVLNYWGPWLKHSCRRVFSTTRTYFGSTVKNGTCQNNGFPGSWHVKEWYLLNSDVAVLSDSRITAYFLLVGVVYTTL